VDDARGDAGLVDGRDDQLHESVIDEDAVADLHLARQRREGRRDLLRVADLLDRGDDEGLPGLEVVHAFDLADAQLRPLDVADDGDVAAELRGHVADDGDDAGVLFVLAVREVEAEGVDARGEEAIDHFLAAAGRAEGGEDFRASHNDEAESINENAGAGPYRTSLRAAARGAHHAAALVERR
jgi:hypothetical protein